MKTRIKNYVKENEKVTTSVRQERNNLPNEQTRLYTVKDMMSIFGVSRRTISNWQSTGILSYIKVGSLLYVSQRQLDEFLQDNTVVGFKRYGRLMA